jgi:catechol 2,3-dioxygenase-like lactoylglutathione lyase family enzyme
MGEYLAMDAIQHVGLTTSDLKRSVQFYTEVLGGVEVLSTEGVAGGDGWNGTDVYYLLMQQALLNGSPEYAAQLQEGGADQLDARYVSFGGMVIEFLDYHAKNHSGRFPLFEVPGVNAAPSVVGNMHISFNIRPDVDLNDAILALEQKSHSKGFTNVWCNRLEEASSHADYAKIPADKRSYPVTAGAFKGWSLAYCMGPDQEYIEFNQVISKAKLMFQQAQGDYVSGKPSSTFVRRE